MSSPDLNRILLVEDDDRDAELTITALDEYNLANQVDRVVDGVEALDYLFKKNNYANRETSHPAVILMDIKMPKKSGIEVLQEIRENDKLKYLPVVVLTSSKEDRDIIKSYELGVNAYVVKPVDFHQFVNAVRDTGVFWAIYNERPPNLCK